MSELATDMESLTPEECRWVASRTELQVTPEVDLLDAGALDSLGFIDLIAFIEQATGLQLDLLALEALVASDPLPAPPALCRLAWHTHSKPGEEVNRNVAHGKLNDASLGQQALHFVQCDGAVRTALSNVFAVRAEHRRSGHCFLNSYNLVEMGSIDANRIDRRS